MPENIPRNPYLSSQQKQSLVRQYDLLNFPAHLRTPLWNIFISLWYEITGRALRVKEEVEQSGRPLRDYDVQPVSNKLVANIERVSAIGQPLAMRCTAPKDKKMTKCTWTSPNGKIFSTASDIDNGKICQIQLASLSEEQLGLWRCRVHLEGENQYQEAFVTATQTLPVQDVRLPRHAAPDTYNIYLTPFLIPDNFTIEGSVEIFVDILQVT